MQQNKILRDFRRLYKLYEDGAVFTAFDTETTGLSPTSNRIIEIGAVKFNKDGIISRWDQLINPNVLIPPFITQLTHISQEMVDVNNTINCYLPSFLELINNTILIGHNVQFDLNFVNAELERCGMNLLKNKCIDTHQYARWAYPTLGKYKLEYLADLMKIDKGQSHRAIDDAETCRQIYLRIINDTKSLRK